MIGTAIDPTIETIDPRDAVDVMMMMTTTIGVAREVMTADRIDLVTVVGVIGIEMTVMTTDMTEINETRTEPALTRMVTVEGKNLTIAKTRTDTMGDAIKTEIGMTTGIGTGRIITTDS